MRHNGTAPVVEQGKIQADAVTRRVLMEVATLLQSEQSLKIVINKAGGVDRRVKLEVTQYIDVGAG